MNELDAAGQIVRLTKLSAEGVLPPAPPQEEPAAAAAEEEPSEGAQTTPGKPDWAELDSLLGAEAGAAVQEYFGQIAAYETFQQEQAAGNRHSDGAFIHKPPKSITFLAGTDKAVRTAVHHFFRRPGLPRLSTDTIAGEAGATCIRLNYHAQNSRKRKRDAEGGGRGRDNVGSWPPGAEKFCRFALYKENLDSGAALALLARTLHCSLASLGLAGTKDKRAVTVQHVTAYKVLPERLEKASQRLRGLKAGNYELVRDALHLGDASGNHFEITLRGVQGGSLADVAAAAGSLKARGFINYYGLQRFGSGAAPTHSIGLQLLKGEWREAVRLILQPHEGEREDSAAARRLYLDGDDIQGALKAMPMYQTAERAILEVPVPWSGFLLPSTCSPLTHTKRSAGAEEAGRQSVCRGAAADPAQHAADVRARVPELPVERGRQPPLAHLRDRARRRGRPRHRPGGGSCPGCRCVGFGFSANACTSALDPVLCLGTAEPLAAEKTEEEEPADMAGPGPVGNASRLPQVHAVTAQEAEAAAYSIDDVVLPIPGCRISYPQHASAQVYTEVAARDGVSLTSAPHKHKDFSLLAMSGGYRRVLHRPADMAWRLLSYSDPDEPLAQTDVERLQGAAPPQVTLIAPGEEAGSDSWDCACQRRSHHLSSAAI